MRSSTKIAGYGLVNNFEGVGLSGNAITIENVTLKRGSSTLKSGLNGGPLEGKGTYPSYIVCNLYGKKGTRFLSMIKHPKKDCPYLTQDGKDRESGPDQYIANMCDGALAGFKYFDLRATKEISVAVKGRTEGTLYVRTSENGKAVASISVSPCREVKEFKAPLKVSGSREALFFTFEGKGSFDFISFTLK